MTNKTQSEALRLAAWLKLAFHKMTLGDALAASNELERLHTENQTLHAGYDAARLEIESLRKQTGQQCLHQIVEPPTMDGATLAGLVSTVGHLSTLVDQQRSLLVEIEDHFSRGWLGSLEDGESEIIDKVRAMLAATNAPQPTNQTLTDEQIDAIADGMPGGLDGFLKGWGWRQFARAAIEATRSITQPQPSDTPTPQFDAMEPEQEALAIQFCEEIAGRKGQPGRLPDPVRLLEMADALYQAERRGGA